ncbi:MAG TPA: zf-HC2 domain-containing protein [Candidatus Angelobacter sp.]|jgi:anti-sigma factor RsiW|nr:zf-HC2 domain-containing protein [Candidatus Angelobacter sp.]
MKCDEASELLPDYLQGRLSADQAAEVEKHLAECAACGEEAALWKKLALLPEEQPSPALESRFKAMLESYQEGRWEKTNLASEKSKTPLPMLWGLGNWRQLPAAGIVWACLFLACGYFIGKHADRGPDAAAQAKLDELRQELGATRQMVALSMLQQQSASQRLEGVSWSTRLPEPDPKVMGALMHTVRFDNNVDVRLAALDALGRYADRPEVRRELVDVLQTTQSPMVQVALIDLLVDLHDKSAVSQFKKFQQDPNVNPTVKKRVDWGIQQLN